MSEEKGEQDISDPANPKEKKRKEKTWADERMRSPACAGKMEAQKSQIANEGSSQRMLRIEQDR